MALTITKYPFIVNQGETQYTGWIDVSTATRVRVQLVQKQGGQYEASIAQSTFDPAQNTPVINHGVDYMCGVPSNGGFIGETPVFDLKEHLGARFIKLAMTNITSEPTHDVYLIVETP